MAAVQAARLVRASQSEGCGMTLTAAQRKAAERARQKESGRVAVTVWVLPEARELLYRYVKRLNERTDRARESQ